MTRKEKAINNFMTGYNCSQSVVLAFSDLLDIEESSLLKIASAFGGGMGRLREVCGAFSGSLIVLGLLYGYDEAETGEAKAIFYQRIQELGLKFEKEKGSLICRELLNLKEKHSSNIPSQRTNEFYSSRPCAALIGYSAEILEEYINNHAKDK